MANVKADTVTADLIEAIETVVEEPAAAAPKKKPAAKKAPAKKQKEETTEVVEVAKPEPVEFMGFEMKEGTDVKAVETAMKEAAEACEAINRKDADLLSSYMALGSAAAEIAPQFKSTKLYGQALAKLAPASSALDPALRSNCKWLFTALNVADAEGSDLLSVLGVNRLEDYKSANPTVIKRDYKKLIKKSERAEALGVDASDEDALADAEKAAKEAAEQEALDEAKKLGRAFKAAFTGYSKAVAAGDMNLDMLLSDMQTFIETGLSGEGRQAVTDDLKACAKLWKE